MGKLFGTDGIRGIVNEGLDAGLAFRAGQAAAIVLGEEKQGRALFLMGKDTRISSDMLECALAAGLCSCGADVLRLGVMPTPTVAYLTADKGADAGVVISASHNPFEHNGIKIFNGQGFKLSDRLEEKIEELILSGKPLPVKNRGELGRVMDAGAEEMNAYIEHLAASVEAKPSGLRIAVDCANGAAARTARMLFSRFDLEVDFINDQPDGLNINKGCGSTHMEGLCRLVREGGYDLGIAFDGDADRCLVSDETGRIADGDRIMAVCGRAMKKNGRLAGDTVVATVMSNLGFYKFAQSEGICLECTDVGDRNVLERMLAGGFILGGEQSGHLIFLEHATTGDGQLAALQFLSVLCASGRRASELVSAVPQYPQILVNVPVSRDREMKTKLMESSALREQIRKEEMKLGGNGRILVRPSGTEALIRVMVEAGETDTARSCAEVLANVIKILDSEGKC